MSFDRKAYISAYNKSHYQERKAYNQQWYQTHKAKNKISVSYDKEYLNKLSNANYHKNKHKKKHIHAWRNILKRTLEYKGVKKSASTLELLGYTAQQLKQRIECQFNNGMSWDNYGTYWEIDHKKAVSRFNENTLPSVVNALSNLQPLIILINRRKSKKIWKTEF
jgi:hypothetical protein